jgi:predicted transcriptional regulator
MKPESMDLVFHALASRPRRKLLDLIQSMPGCCVNDVSTYFEFSRIAVIKHLQILEQAQLIVVQKNGRRRELYFNAVPIQMIYDRWTSEYSSLWAAKAVDLKLKLEVELSETTSSKSIRKRTP